MLGKILFKYPLKILLPSFLCFNVLISYFITYIAMSFFSDPNYKIAFFIATFCSFFGSLIMITPSIILYFHIDKVNKEAALNFKIDPLTQLPSRLAFSEHFKEILASKSFSHLGVIFIDLDHFKKINDTYGHLAGDEVMAQVGKILKAQMSTVGYVARYGGEEFVALIENAPAPAFEKLLENIRFALDSEMVYKDKNISFSASLGGVLAYHDSLKYNEWLKLADGQMYLAKAKGRNRTEFLNLWSKTHLKENKNPVS